MLLSQKMLESTAFPAWNRGFREEKTAFFQGGRRGDRSSFSYTFLLYSPQKNLDQIMGGGGRPCGKNSHNIPLFCFQELFGNLWKMEDGPMEVVRRIHRNGDRENFVESSSPPWRSWSWMVDGGDASQSILHLYTHCGYHNSKHAARRDFVCCEFWIAIWLCSGQRPISQIKPSSNVNLS